MQKENQPKIKKVLFYTHSPAAFRTTLIGFLYEIAQVYPVVLLSERLDSESEAALKNKELFPKLEEIIPVRQFTGEKMSLFVKNKYLFKLAKNTIQKHRPDVLVLASDTQSLFELYLARFAKKTDILAITMQPFVNVPDVAVLAKRVDLTNAHAKFPSFLPFWLRLFLVECRKHFGHFLYYYLLPLMQGEKPFFGKSSFVFRRGVHGTRDADYQIVFSERDYRIYREVYLDYGVSPGKLHILSHPLAREAKKFFETAYFGKYKKNGNNNKKIISMMLKGGLGFARKDHSLISIREREETWIEIIKLTSRIFSEWKIYVKPHPNTKNINKIKDDFESVSDNIKVADPKEPSDPYIEMADIVIGLPISATTTLFTASFQCPEKPIISIDFHQEMMGDLYKDFPGITYVSNKEEFLNVLKLIRRGRYLRKNDFHKENNKEFKKIEFSNTVEMLDCLYLKKHNLVKNNEITI